MNVLLVHFVTALALTAATTLVLGTFVLLKNPHGRINRVFAAYSCSIAWWSFFQIWLAAGADRASALLWARVEQIGVFFIPTLFLHFVFSLLGTKNRRGILTLGYALSVVFAGLSLSPHMMADAVPKFFVNYFATPGKLYIWAILFFVAYILLGLHLLFQAFVRSSGVRRNQLKYLFWSTLLGYIGGGANFLLVFGISVPVLNPFGTYAVPVYVFATTYAIVRYRLMDVSIVLTRMALFIIVYVPLLMLPVLMGKLLQLPLTALIGSNWWTIPMAFEALFAVGGLVAYRFVQQRAEERLLTEQRRYQAILRQASQSMTLIKELGKLLSRTVALLTKEVGLSHVAIYLWDQRAKKYIPRASRWWKISVPPTFGPQDALLRYFDFSHNPAVAGELQLQVRSSGELTGLHEVVASLRALRAAVVVPSFVEKRCIGFLVLGEKKSGALYTPDDLAVFQVLANQAALAVENAIFYEELKQTQADLFQTAKMADLGRMAGGMSHQINNRFHVLTILAGTIMSVMKDKNPRAFSPEEIQKWWDKVLETFTKVEDNALRGGGIVKTLLKFSRPSGEYKPVTWPTVAATALEVVQHRVDLARFDLKQQFPDGLSAVNGDHNLLADCLFNLISNAYDAMEHKAQLLAKNQLPVHSEDPSPYRGRLVLRGRPGRSEDDKEWVVLEVADNGAGMTPEEAECLFFPFFTTKATAEKGTGLGLYVIKRVIEQHGGTISCQSEYGVGTTFTIRLPACASAPESPPAPQEKPNA